MRIGYIALTARAPRLALKIGGRRVEGPLRIEKGRHRLRLTKDEGSLYLLHADIKDVAFDMTAPREQQVLFDRVYPY